MQVKVTSLTASQTSAVKAELSEDVVVKVVTTYVILNGSASEMRDEVQRAMDAIREARGGRDSNYRSLVAVRNKLESAAKSPTGKTTFVNPVPNGADLTAAAPSLLDGVASTVVEDTAPVKTKRKWPRLTIAQLPNLEYMRKTAPNAAAEEFWQRKIKELEPAT